MMSLSMRHCWNAYHSPFSSSRTFCIWGRNTCSRLFYFWRSETVAFHLRYSRVWQTIYLLQFFAGFPSNVRL
jgi:hypothetical protein